MGQRRGLAAARWVRGLCLAGGLLALDGIYLIVRTAPGSSHWFGIELLLGGLALVILAVGARLGAARLIIALGLVILISSLHSGLRSLGSTSSPLYPARYYARTPAITFAEQACVGHRTLVLDNAFPVNVGDVFRKLQTQNGYGATMHVPYYDFISTVPWNSPEGTRLLDLRCIVTRQPLTLAGYRLAYHDSSGVLIYVNLDTSALNTVGLQPVPAENPSRGDRDFRYRFYLSRPTTLILSALVYPGWKLSVDGRRPATGAFRVRGVAVFPEVTLGSGAHTLNYSWSGWPA